MMDICMVAMRGRWDGSAWVQQLELGESDISHAITTVTKDGLIMESAKIGSVYNDGSQCGTVIKDSGLVSIISAGTHGYCNPHITQQIRAIDEQNMAIRDTTWGTVMTDGSSPKHNNRVLEMEKMAYRIRKLTPKECWRLMDFSDQDFEKAQSVSSNTALYKQAGNSIVKNVLVGIFGQLFDGKENVYKSIS